MKSLAIPFSSFIWVNPWCFSQVSITTVYYFKSLSKTTVSRLRELGTDRLKNVENSCGSSFDLAASEDALDDHYDHADDDYGHTDC